jgi:putative NIF3 family GTP cyclohydrolase 1 type 2
MTATVRQVIGVLEAAYPPALAESWDAVGLVCGDPEEPVRRVLVAVDPAAEHLAAGGPALVDVAHWASEHPWCAQAASVVSAAFGGTVDVCVSQCRTDPWTIGSAEPGRSPR